MPAKARLLAGVRSDAGVGTVLGLTLVFAIVSVASATLWAASNLVANSQLRTQTETAALYAQQTLIGAVTGYPCENAETVFTLNMVLVEKCLIVGDGVVVATSWKPFGVQLEAKATAVPVN